MIIILYIKWDTSCSNTNIHTIPKRSYSSHLSTLYFLTIISNKHWHHVIYFVAFLESCLVPLTRTNQLHIQPFSVHNLYLLQNQVDSGYKKKQKTRIYVPLITGKTKKVTMQAHAKYGCLSKVVTRNPRLLWDTRSF